MEKRVEDSLKRIDAEASKMQRELEKTYLRKIQVCLFYCVRALFLLSLRHRFS